MPDPQILPSIHHFLPPDAADMAAQYGPDFPDNFALEQEMIILFSDMRGFTECSESYAPHDVYASINASLAIQARLIHQHGGSVNKFLGDGLLACFSGEHMAQQLLDCLLELLVELPAHEGEHLPCGVGFGVHRGYVLFGLLGDKHRREFTVIGDVVNTAARLCGLASPFQALLTERVLSDVPDDVRRRYCRYLRRQPIRGKKQAVEIYEVKPVATAR